MISFQWTSESDVDLWTSDFDFHDKVFALCILYYQNFWPRIFWLSIFRIAVHGRYYITRVLFLFVPREISTCNNFCLIIFCYYYFFILFSIPCFWYLHCVIFAFQQKMAFWTFLPFKQLWIAFTWTPFILF